MNLRWRQSSNRLRDRAPREVAPVVRIVTEEEEYIEFFETESDDENI